MVGCGWVGWGCALTACTVHVCLTLATVFWPLPPTTELVEALVLVPTAPAAVPSSMAIPETLRLLLLVLALVVLALSGSCVVVLSVLLLLLLLLPVVMDGGGGDALREGGRLEVTACVVDVDELVGTAGDGVAAVVGESSLSPIA